MSIECKADMSQEEKLMMQKEDYDNRIIEAAKELLWNINQSGRDISTYNKNVSFIEIYIENNQISVMNLDCEWELIGTIDNVK